MNKQFLWIGVLKSAAVVLALVIGIAAFCAARASAQAPKEPPDKQAKKQAKKQTDKQVGEQTDTKPNQHPVTVFVVVGAAGEAEYGKTFAESAGHWEKACAKAGAKFVRIGPRAGESKSKDEPATAKDVAKDAPPDEPAQAGDAGPPKTRSAARNKTKTDKDLLKEQLALAIDKSGADIWLVLIGHGTFDSRVARFNLRGPDVSAKELDQWLSPMQRPLVVINGASASGPFIKALSAPNRVIVTATKSGYEHNLTRFNQYICLTIGDAKADLDKDGQTSLLEAYLMASRAVADFYRLKGRLATEHALLDDNGDGLGTPADWFRGIRSIKKAKGDASPDGRRAHQFHLVQSAFEQAMPPQLRARRDELELQVMELRDRKESMPQGQYYAKLETLLIELAKIYRQADKPKDSAK